MGEICIYLITSVQVLNLLLFQLMIFFLLPYMTEKSKVLQLQWLMTNNA